MEKHMKLTEQERAIIIEALTVAACQYGKDAEQAADLALHGMAMSAAAETLAAQFRHHADAAKQLRDKMTFLWEHLEA
jgi:hypothetical protein